MPSISHPTDRPNFAIVNFDAVTVAFSYETMIGFCVPGRVWVISQNNWGATTGKHLNYLDPDKSKRVGRAEFEEEFREQMNQYRRDRVLSDLKLPAILFDNRRTDGA